MHSAEKAHDTTLDEEKYSQHSVVITLIRGHHIPANKPYIHAYIELQYWPV